MREIFYVAAGGAIGSVLRYLVAIMTRSFTALHFPVNTFLVNIIGCFAIGYFYAVFHRTEHFEFVRIFLIIGILGGFTTFSTFSLEVIQMFKDKMIYQALLYILSSNILGIFAAYVGYSIKS